MPIFQHRKLYAMMANFSRFKVSCLANATTRTFGRDFKTFEYRGHLLTRTYATATKVRNGSLDHFLVQIAKSRTREWHYCKTPPYLMCIFELVSDLS